MLSNLSMLCFELVVATILSTAAASLIPSDRIAHVFKVASFCFVVGVATIELTHPSDALSAARIGVLLMARQIFLTWLATLASPMLDTDAERWLDEIWLIEVFAATLLILVGVFNAFLAMVISKSLGVLLEVIK